MLIEAVIVEDMNARDRCLAHQVEHVAAGPTKTDNPDMLTGYSRRERTDPATRARRVHVMTRRLINSGGDDQTGRGGGGRNGRHRRTRDLSFERDHLFIVVGKLPPQGPAAEPVIYPQPIAKVPVVIGCVNHPEQRSSFAVARERSCKRDLVIPRRNGPVSSEVEPRDDHSPANAAMAIDVGHVAQDQIPRDDIYVVALLGEAAEVRTKTYWSP